MAFTERALLDVLIRQGEQASLRLGLCAASGWKADFGSSLKFSKVKSKSSYIGSLKFVKFDSVAPLGCFFSSYIGILVLLSSSDLRLSSSKRMRSYVVR